MLEELYRQSQLFRKEQQKLAEHERTINKHNQPMNRTRARRMNKQVPSL